jgi:hypothetical protein
MLYTKNMDQISERLKFLIPQLSQEIEKYMENMDKTPLTLLFDLESFLTFRKSLQAHMHSSSEKEIFVLCSLAEVQV